jgi:hypothetical protein
MISIGKDTGKEPPVGALSEDERARVCELLYEDKKQLFRSMHRVDALNGILTTRKGADDGMFLFTWQASKGYYFTNYFHALAYSLQLKAKLRAENGTQMDLDQTP